LSVTTRIHFDVLQSESKYILPVATQKILPRASGLDADEIEGG
jgi:hypothetical protein